MTILPVRLPFRLSRNRVDFTGETKQDAENDELIVRTFHCHGRNGSVMGGLHRILLLSLGTASLMAAYVAAPRTLLGQAEGVVFTDASDKIDFVHRSVEYGGNGLAGAAWFDYDNDGLLDLFLTNGKTQPSALFRNQGDGTFENIAASAGLEPDSGCSGVIAADFDNDGWKDLLLTGDGGILQGTAQAPLVLYRNLGDGTFEDVTISSGIDGPPTQLSASTADIDGDSYLDIFISASGSVGEDRNDRNKLFRNNGDFTFTDISASSGVDTNLGACTSLFSDYDHDGDQDLIVANCNDREFRPTPLELFRNNGDLTFTDVAVEAGLSRKGLWMGICGSDYDHDGDTDLFVTNLGNGHAFFENQGDGTFVDRTMDLGVLPYPFGWGCAFTDFDNDGYDDLFWTGSLVGICPPRAPAAPGSRCVPVGIIGPGAGNPGTLLFSDDGNGFASGAEVLPLDMSELYTSGVAHGDFDGNGFEDILIMTDRVPADLGNDARPGNPVLLQNAGNENGWVRLKLRGTVSNHDAVGARVVVFLDGGIQSKEVRAGSSMLSQHSQWLTFGLGAYTMVDSVHVTWPTGTTESYASVASRQTVDIVEGGGRVLPVAAESTGVPRFAAGVVTNYPNPFKTSTRIEYTLDEAGPIRISIVDVTGRNVRQVLNSRESAGRHVVTWNRLDDRGERVSAGVYLLVRSTARGRQGHMMIIVE